MPRYFFDFDTGKGSWPDEEGSELTGAQEARSQAVRTLTEIAKDIVDDEAGLSLCVTVRDAKGGPVYEATMTLAGRWSGEGDGAAR